VSVIEEQTDSPSRTSAEHEVVDEELRATVEELGERLRSGWVSKL